MKVNKYGVLEPVATPTCKGCIYHGTAITTYCKLRKIIEPELDVEDYCVDKYKSRLGKSKYYIYVSKHSFNLKFI